jgi:TonB family protein
MMNAHMPEAIACLERHCLTNHRSGRVTVRFVVAVDGRVEAAEVAESTLASPVHERSLLNALRTWTFPAPSGGSVTLSYPFIFHCMPI